MFPHEDWDPNEHARASDPHTSHAAAHSLNPLRVGSLMRRILEEIERMPGTHTEVAARLGLDPVKVWKRISDLKNAGRIVDSGSTHVGPTGRDQIVWVRAGAVVTAGIAFDLI